MSEEEKKAIEQFKEINLEDCSCEKCLYQEIEECHGCPTMIKEILLNLIEKQDEMINLMAGRIVELLEEKNITNHSKKDVIDIFKNLAVNNLLKEGR